MQLPVAGAIFLLVTACSPPPPQPDRIIDYRHGLRLVLFTPAIDSASGTAPALVFYHGGGWEKGSPEQFYRQCAQLKRNGFHCIGVEYLPDDTRTNIETILSNSLAAFEFILENADELSIDPGSIILAGASAGGQIALTTARRSIQNGISIRGLVLFNPVLDLSPGAPDHAIAGKQWRELSPIHQDPAYLPPTLLIQGSVDTEVAPETADRFCELATRSQRHCELISYPGAGHGFFNHGVSRYYFFRSLWDLFGFLNRLGLGNNLRFPYSIHRLLG